MCACDSNWTCSKCVDTPADPRYLEDEHEPQEDVAPFDREREHAA
jgi:hypothetical protein